MTSDLTSFPRLDFDRFHSGREGEVLSCRRTLLLMDLIHTVGELRKRLGGERSIVLVPTAYPELNAERIRALGKIGMVIYGNHAIRAAVTELAIPSADAPALLPEGTRVLDVAYTQGGTVYIDFSPELDASRGVGTEEERTVIQGIVTTIADNFTAVRRVVILVDGKIPKPGHFDLSRPLRREEPFFATDEDTEVSPSPGPALAAPVPAAPAPAAPTPAPPSRPAATPGPQKSPASSREGGNPLP